MKQIFSIIVALVVAMSATAATIVINGSDFSGGVVSTGGPVSLTKSGVTVSTDKGYADGNELRIYQGGYISISATEAMTSITFEHGASTKETLSSQTPNAATWSYTPAKQVRLTKITIVTNGDPGTGGGGTGGNPEPEPEPEPEVELDPAYVYAEPTVVGVPSTTASAGAQEFVENNIKVSITQGAIYADYFNCYADNSITFTATQEIKAMVVRGYIKKGFSATATAGVVANVDASEEDKEANPVLVVTDINATSFTLSCAKQIRFYSIDFYFVENPDIEIGGDEELEYSYEWEPEDVTTFDLVMTDFYVLDMTENLGYKAVFIEMENDEAYLATTAFVDYDEVCGIAPGTYPIDFTFVEGTIEASVGGDEYLDYGTYLMTNYETIGGEDYYDPYYIVSGTLTVSTTESGFTYELNGLSYYGSTIHVTYSAPFATAVEPVVKSTDLRKRLVGGQLVIVREGKMYNALGARL